MAGEVGFPVAVTESVSTSARVAVVIPCHNEELTVGKVVADFRAVLPEAQILVVDNASQDSTAAVARAAGAVVILVMVDGDDTYPAEDSLKLLEAAKAGAEMVIGTRLTDYEAGAFRAGHS